MHPARRQTNKKDHVEPGSEAAAIIAEELATLAAVQKALADREIGEATAGEYDRELLSLRDQIAEARTEDVAPLVAEMYRLQALGARSGAGRSMPVDPQCPYFGHLRLVEGKKTRDVLIGNSGFVPTNAKCAAIVDWRNAPVSRVYYRYDEGDDYEESFGGRMSHGTVIARRTVSVSEGQLRRITWSKGSVGRRADGTWVHLSVGVRPTLAGGAGTAARPSEVEPVEAWRPGKLGVVGDESLRDDKRLQAITGLIDKQQFDLITRPDSGIVILQGGAGSGKTTVALHRAAYLHYQKPGIFSPKKMTIVVRSPALTEYIARVLPSLGVPGIKVVTLADWMSKARKKVLPRIERELVDDVPAAVARLKKHPAVMQVLADAVAEEAGEIGEELGAKIPAKDQTARKAVADKWGGLVRYALVPRIREMERWLESAAAQRGGITPKLARDLLGVLRRAKGPAGDVELTWAAALTDGDRLAAAFERRAPGDVSGDEIAELVKWVSLQAEEIESEEEVEDDDESRAEHRRAQHEAEVEMGLRPSERADEDEDDGILRGIGVDGRHVDEDTAQGRLDEHDDALLLRLTQLKLGSLPIAGTQKTLAYEHIVVDEAQDLSPTDVSVLKGALTSRQSMTLAGDTAQKLVFDNGFSDWKGLLADLDITGLEIEPLRISYRSTREVMSFARHVLGPLADPVEPVCTRSGAEVEQFPFGTTGEAIAFIGEALRSLVMRERKASVALVTRYAAHANMYYEGLRNAEVPNLRRVHGKEFSFSSGIDVVDVSQVKGLEYDYVILAEVNASTYPAVHEARHLLHIAATRAVYQLWVTSVGAPSPLLPPAFG